MHNPIKRIQAFVKDQADKAKWEQAKHAWSQRVPALLPSLHEIAAIFNRALVGRSEVSVLSDAKRDRFPLVIAFCSESDSEIAASALFRSEHDGIVYGYRYPFHAAAHSVRAEVFADLGGPDGVTVDRIGNFVVDFLEWATVGEGKGHNPQLRTAQSHERPNLRLVA